MTYSEKKNLYEQIIWTIARIVKSSINQLDDIQLNESIININDISRQFIGAINCALNEEVQKRQGNYKVKWTDETIRKFVKDNDIKTKTQLFNYKPNGGSVYNKAKELGILDDIFGETHWNKERTIDWLKKHPNVNSRNKLRTENRSAYNAALRDGYIDEIFKRIRNKYTKEECLDAALRCEYRSEFQKLYNKEYQAAIEHGWLEEITKHMPKQKNEDNITYLYTVYVYEDKKYHSAYVGITSNPKQRDWQHRTPNENGFDSLGLYCINHNISVPTMKILKNNIRAKEAIDLEFEYWYYYKNSGWNMINSEKTLGFLGAGERKWTKETIIKYIKDNNFETAEQLRKQNPYVYRKIKELRIIADLFPEYKKQRANGYLDNEDNIKNEASKYNTAQEFKDNDKSAFYKALKYEWFNKMFPEYHIRKSRGYYDKEENVRNEVKKYKTPSELAKKDDSAYRKWKYVYHEPMQWFKQDDE